MQLQIRGKSKAILLGLRLDWSEGDAFSLIDHASTKSVYVTQATQAYSPE